MIIKANVETNPTIDVKLKQSLGQGGMSPEDKAMLETLVNRPSLTQYFDDAKSNILYWNGETIGLENYENFYKVSDVTPKYGNLQDYSIYVTYREIKSHSLMTSELSIVGDNSAGYCALGTVSSGPAGTQIYAYVMYENNSLGVSAGTYLSKYYEVSALDVGHHVYEKKVIKEDCLPDKVVESTNQVQNMLKFSGGDILNWDGDTEGLEVADANFYRVSAAIPTFEELSKVYRASSFIKSIYDWNRYSNLVVNDYRDTEGYCSIDTSGLADDHTLCRVYYKGNAAEVTSGTYFYADETIFVDELVLGDYGKFAPVLKEECLPQSLSGYAKSADHYTKTETDNKYQPKGNYLTDVPSEYVTESELAAKKYLTNIPSEYVTETELSAKKYLTSIPSEYITETELTAKKYATQTSVDSLSEEIDDLKGVEIPDYWYGAFTDSAGVTYTEYLTEKIARIKELLDAGGINCFAFPFVTDIHMESNLGKKAPLLMGKIMKACALPYALCGGDSNTRHGADHDLEYLENEWLDIDAMFEPILDRLLIQDGNHDGSGGIIDANSDGTADDINADGVVDANDKNVYNFTPEQKYSRIRRKASLINGVKFDATGNAFYVDDKTAKVRYIMLNSHNNQYEENEDGSAKYNNMTHFRFGQAQYDFLTNDALTTVSDGYSVIVCCHVPLDRTQEYVYWGGERNSDGSPAAGSIADCMIMQKLLNAYKKKTSYSGTFGGTASGGMPYTNYADTSSADWWTESRLDSSGNKTSATGGVVTCYIPFKYKDKIYVKNATVYTANRFAVYDSSKARLYLNTGAQLSISTGTNGETIIDTSNFDSKFTSYNNSAYIRLPLSAVGDNPIITVNEEIVDVALEGYDAVSVSADFTSAKGDLIFMVCGHVHEDKIWSPSLIYNNWEKSEFPIVASRSDGKVENTSEMQAERVAGTITEQSFDVYVVNTKTKQCDIVKIGAGADRSFAF